MIQCCVCLAICNVCVVANCCILPKTVCGSKWEMTYGELNGHVTDDIISGEGDTFLGVGWGWR